MKLFTTAVVATAVTGVGLLSVAAPATAAAPTKKPHWVSINKAAKSDNPSDSIQDGRWWLIVRGNVYSKPPKTMSVKVPRNCSKLGLRVEVQPYAGMTTDIAFKVLSTGFRGKAKVRTHITVGQSKKFTLKRAAGKKYRVVMTPLQASYSNVLLQYYGLCR